VAVSEASSLSTVILGRRAVVHCMRFGRQRLPGLYPGRGLAHHGNSFTKYLRDMGAFRDLLIIFQFVKRSEVHDIDHESSHSDPVLKRSNPVGPFDTISGVV